MFCPHAFTFFNYCSIVLNIIFLLYHSRHIIYIGNKNVIVFFMCLFIMLFCFRLSESCSHIAAVLFKVEAAIHLGYTRHTIGTTLWRRWNQLQCTASRSFQKSATNSAEQICHPEHHNWPKAKTVAGKSHQLLTTASWPQPFRGTLPSILLEGNSRTGAIVMYFTLPKKTCK